MSSHSIDLKQLPRHIAVIMDGSGRWAEQQGAARTYGHKQAIRAVEEVIDGCKALKIPYLTLYVFSRENWQRPIEEVDLLMELFITTLHTQIIELTKRNVRISCIGELSTLPERVVCMLQKAIDQSQSQSDLHLCLALNYSGRWDITQATRKIASQVQSGHLSVDEINEETFQEALETQDIPDPELLIRTGGEERISNFLLWQIAYTELYVTDVFWPDFRQHHLHEAICAYQQRERRFGKISAQIKS